MSNVEIEDIYPASLVQQGMLFHYLVNKESGVYLLQIVYALSGKLNDQAFVQAWHDVVVRHPILRTSVMWEGLDEPLQIVHKNLRLPIEQLDWSDCPLNDRRARLEAFLEADRRRGFDIARGPLLRLTLVQLDAETRYCIWTQHHLTMDGWSRPLVLEEVFTAYKAICAGQTVALPTRRPFRDYIEWLQEQDPFVAEPFWRTALDGIIAPTPLGIERAARAQSVADARFNLQEFRCSEELTTALKRVARQHQVTLNALMQSAWALLRSRYSGEQDVVYGSVVSGRSVDLPAIESMIGCFVNTLPVRVRVAPGQPLMTWVKEVQSQQWELRDHEFMPLNKIHSWSDVPGDQPLFESVLAFENYPISANLYEPAEGLKLSLVSFSSWTHYPLVVSLFPERELTMIVKYDLSRLDDAAVTRMFHHFRTLLGGIARNPMSVVVDLPLLTEPERQQMVAEWNDNHKAHPTDQRFHELVEAQAHRTPDAVAIIYGNEQLTYRELNERTNQLARSLRRRGVGPEVLVGLHCERSPLAMIAILGVLKAGGAYLPFDPSIPKDRLSFLLKDAGASLLLTRAEMAADLPELSLPVVCLDTDWHGISRESCGDLSRSGVAENMAYVIYTSGSTGTPKGVCVEHRHLLNHIQDYLKRLGPVPGDNFMLVQSLSVDASIQTIVMALCSGGCLHIIPQELALDATAMSAYFSRHRIDYLKLAPSHIRALHGASPQDRIMPKRWLILGGEATGWEWMRALQQLAPDCRVISQYGPTETAVAMMTFPVGEALHDDRHTVTPLGTAITNTQVYVLDRYLNPVPIGVTGELYIGGANVTRGYLNRPDVTADRYVPDPFSGLPGARLYSSGDLARYLADGNIEFVSRADDQIKIRGFRVEPGEVQVELGQHPAVREALILIRQESTGEKRLVAFAVPLPGQSLTADELRKFLRVRLPDFMVPASIMVLHEVPRTPHGKIDRQALMALDSGPTQLRAQVSAPRTPVHEMLAGIWGSVLGLREVDLDTSFFDLGGDSLRATQVVARIRDAFRVDLPLRHLFESPTIASLAVRIQKALVEVDVNDLPLEPKGLSGPIPLSFAQQRMWFLDRLSPGVPVYNVPLAHRLKGQLHPAVLHSALQHLVDRHDALRTTFPAIDGKPVQQIAPNLDIPLATVDLSHLPPSECDAQWQGLSQQELCRPFDLQAGPLVRATLYRLGGEDHVLNITMHHIVTDWWSNDLFMRELQQVYEAFLTGAPSPLPAISLHYADFAVWQREWLQGEVFDRQLAYWKRQLAGDLPVLQLPSDRPRPAVQSFRGALYSQLLPWELLERLQDLSRVEGVTMYMTLLAAFNMLLYRLTGQEDLLVGSPIAGRNRVDLEGLFGLFVNTLVMRTQVSGTATYRELLRRVREITLEAYAHQDLPFEKLVEVLQPDRDSSFTPVFQVTYGHRNALNSALRIGDAKPTPLSVDLGLAKFDLGLFTMESDEGLLVLFDYNTDLFDQATISRFTGCFRTLLEQMAADLDQTVAEIPMLAADDWSLLVREWNDARESYPSDQCIHQLFEQQAAQRPDATAVIFGDEKLTYGELNRRANQLAHHLRELGVGPEKLVGLMVDRSIEMIVAILGILKAGCAYVPLDPAIPSERLSAILEDARAAVLLTQARLLSSLPNGEAQVVCVDRDWPAIATQNTVNPVVTASPENLAYVIYTSGSTGRPNGVLVEHRGFCSFITVAMRKFQVSPESRVAAFASIGFDASVWQIFMGLCSGATLCVASRDEQQSIPALTAMFQRNRVTVADLPVIVLDLLPEGAVPDLQWISTGGERCPVTVAARWSQGRHFFNVYGPTEATVATAWYLVECVPDGATNVPIGRPVPNAQVYILDAELRPVPVGVPGELYIGGNGVTRGYLNRSELTAQRFVPNPFSEGRGERLYKTGDLARYRSGGNIEFLGRTDKQVKVRGFRIELEEIEAVLIQFPALQEAAVIVWGDQPGNKRLVAYIVGKPGASLDENEIRRFMRGKLPEYMIPSVFVTLGKLPRNTNRKVDAFALPVPVLLPEAASATARNREEQLLSQMWADLLGLEATHINIYDNFFALGGHSLLATQLVSRIRETFSVELPLISLFECPTIADQASAIVQAALQQVGNERAAELLDQINSLSEQEVTRLLSENLQEWSVRREKEE